MVVLKFLLDVSKEVVRGSKLYWTWLGILVLLILFGATAYVRQAIEGLVVTGMSDQVSWGFYISNFTFLVGVAAAAVMLVIPTYIFHDTEAKKVVIIAEAMAVAAVIMCMLFVTVDLGRPDRIWHMLPGIGLFNFPHSMLAWDVLVLNGYLVLNLVIPAYFLFNKYKGTEPNPKIYFPAVLLAIFWAISIHTVTAFLLSSNSGRPFWNIALLAPRFIASAFTAGPALIILALRVIDAKTEFEVGEKVIKMLSVITAVSMLINLFMLGSELFKELYNGSFAASHGHYLFFGLNGQGSLVPWIWVAVAFNVTAAILLMIHKTRNSYMWLNVACVLAAVGVWIEKGMGLIVPGFIPTPLGEVMEYSPSIYEISIAIGVWAIGLLIFSILVKTIIPILTGRLSYKAS